MKRFFKDDELNAYCIAYLQKYKANDLDGQIRVFKGINELTKGDALDIILDLEFYYSIQRPYNIRRLPELLAKDTQAYDMANLYIRGLTDNQPIVCDKAISFLTNKYGYDTTMVIQDVLDFYAKGDDFSC